MGLQQQRDEVASALYELIKKASESPSYQDPVSLKTLADAFATVASCGSRSM